MSDIELLPCPFCNWSNALVTQQTVRGQRWQVICGWSLCYGSQGPYADTEREAIAAWNRRVPAQRSSDAPSLAREAALVLARRMLTPYPARPLTDPEIVARALLSTSDEKP